MPVPEGGLCRGLKMRLRFIIALTFLFVLSLPPATHVAAGEKKAVKELLNEAASKYFGAPYRRGGRSTKGMDCSGLVCEVYREVFGIDLPHSASGLYPLSLFNDAPLDYLQPGDLVFFSTGKKKRITHVGIYLSGGEFIHAARSNGVSVSTLGKKYWKEKILGAKRLSNLTCKSDKR